MNNILKSKALALVLASLLISSCSSTDEKDAGFTDENAADNGAQTSGVGDSSLSGSEFGGSNGSGNSFGDDGSGTGGFGDGRNGGGTGSNGNKVIYFMYDSSQVMEEFVPVISSYARNLKSNPSEHLVIEGHTDERGSREYNIALGEQRAKAVARMLTMQGARDSQIEIVSYGEEKPASSGHDESAWQLNRRAELDTHPR